MSDNLGGSIRHNTAWILGGDAFARAIRFATGIVLAHLLAPEDFGLLVTVQVFTGALGFVATGGMGEALVQAKQVDELDFKVVFTVQFLVCLCIYAAFYHLAPYVALSFDEPRYADLLRVSALTFLLRPFGTVARARLRRSMRFKEITQSQFHGMLFSTPATLILAYQGFGTWALLLGALLGTLVNSLVLCRAAGLRPAIRFCPKVTRRLGGFGLRITATEIVAYLRSQTANLILSHFQGPQWVGLYNKAASQSELPIQVVSAAAYQTVFRALSSVQDNLDKSKYLYLRTIALVAVYTLPLYVGLAWLAKPFIVFVYGAKWQQAAAPLVILATTGLFRVVQNPSGAVIAAQNALGRELRIELESWALLTAGVLIGRHWGIQGIAWGVVPAAAYSSLRMAAVANRLIHGSFAELLAALTPALVLNGGLMVVLALTHAALPDTLAGRSPGIYLAIMGAIGATGYVLAFLYAPIPALATEAERWRRHARRLAGSLFLPLARIYRWALLM